MAGVVVQGHISWFWFYFDWSFSFTIGHHRAQNVSFNDMSRRVSAETWRSSLNRWWVWKKNPSKIPCLPHFDFQSCIEQPSFPKPSELQCFQASYELISQHLAFTLDSSLQSWRVESGVLLFKCGSAFPTAGAGGSAGVAGGLADGPTASRPAGGQRQQHR